MKRTRDTKGISLIVLILAIAAVIILGVVIARALIKEKPATTGVTQKDLGKWVQDGRTVKRGDVVLETGDKVTLKLEGETEGKSYTAEGYKGEWAVLGAENGKLLLVSTKEVETEIDLYGKNGKTEGIPIDAGYDNGIDKLNKISEKYINTKYAESARSITAEDLVKVIGYEPEKSEKNGINYAYNVNYEQFTNTKAHNVLFKNANYWCATKYNWSYENYTEYGYPMVYGDYDIFNYDLYTSNGSENLRPSGVRAVVSLRTNVEVIKK